MAQRKRKKPSLSVRLSPWQAQLLLCIFLAVRGLAPAGFMPAPIADGTPYDFCHGDGRSALLLQSLSQPHSHRGHHGHGHDALTAQAFADNHCSFSAGAGATAPATLELPPVASGRLSPPIARFRSPLPRRGYLQPPQRAPPFSRSA